MAKTAAAIPPYLKSNWRDAAENDEAVGIEDVPVVLLGFELGEFDGVTIKVLDELVVVVKVREVALETGVVAVLAPEDKDEEEVAPIENEGVVA